jgi:GT2 family glycosyltransferase
VRRAQTGAQCFAFGRNLGFAEGYNRALGALKHTWAVLLNQDAVLDAAWLERLLGEAERDPRTAVWGGKLLFHPAERGPGILQSVGACLTDAGAGFEIGWGEPDRGQYDAPRSVGSIPGAAMLARRSVFFELGGFDPRYFAYLEDVDLCWRAWLAGYAVRCVPGATAWHRYGTSGGGRSSPFRIRLMQRNRLANMLKHLEGRSLGRAVPVSMAYDLYRLVQYAAGGQGVGARALAAGTLAFWRGAGGLLAERRRIQGSRVVSDRRLRELGVLAPVVQAFREYRRLSRLPAA